MDPFTQYAIVY